MCYVNVKVRSFSYSSWKNSWKRKSNDSLSFDCHHKSELMQVKRYGKQRRFFWHATMNMMIYLVIILINRLDCELWGRYSLQIVLINLIMERIRNDEIKCVKLQCRFALVDWIFSWLTASGFRVLNMHWNTFENRKDNFRPNLIDGACRHQLEKDRRCD